MGVGAVVAAVTKIWAAVKVVATAYSIYTAWSIKKESNSPTYGWNIETQCSNELPVPIIYGGPVKVAGNIVWQETSMDNQYLKMFVAISEGEIESIEDVRANDIPFSELEGSSYNIYLGTKDQMLDSRCWEGEWKNGISKVGSLRNVAYIAVTIKASDKISGGTPNITAIVKGRKVRVWEDEAWIVKYSDNPSWCLLDLLTNFRYGGGYLDSQINMDSFKSAAEYCDEQITVNGETKTRFSIGLVIDWQASLPEIANQIRMACRGYIASRNGQVSFKIEQPENPVQEFTMDHMVPGSLQITVPGKDDVWELVQVTYVDPEQNYAKIPAQSVDESNPIFPTKKEFTIVAVNRFDQASRLAYFYRVYSKYCGLSGKFKTTIRALNRTAGDVICLTEDVMGWVKKPVRIFAIRYADDHTHEIYFREYNETIYGDVLGSAKPTLNYTERPNPFAPPPEPSDVIVEESSFILKSGEMVTEIDISFTPGRNMFYSHTEVLMSENDSDIWKNVGPAIDGSLSVHGLQIGVKYTFMLKTVTQSGIKSSGVIQSITTIGKDKPPSDVTSLTAVQNEYNRAEILLSWPAIDATLNPDLRGYEVRVGESWDIGTKINGLVYGLQMTYTVTVGGHYIFWVKAQDNSGGYSINAAKAEIDITVKPNAPASGTMIQDVNDKSNLILSWDAIPDKDFAKFVVRLGNDWDTGVTITSTKETSIQYRVNASGIYNFMIRAVNLTGFLSAILNIQANIDVHPSNVTNLTIVQNDTDRRIVKFAWDGIADKDFAYYEIRKGIAWGTAELVATKIGNPYYDFVATTSETVTFLVAAYNKAGFCSNDPVSKTINISLVPSRPGAGSVVSDPENRLKLNITWEKVPDLDIDFYEVKYGSTVIAKTGETTVSYVVSGNGSYEFSIRAKNKADVYSSPLNLIATVQAEPANVPSFTVQQSPLDRRILQFTWGVVADTDLSHYEIRKGSNWDTAEVFATGIKATVLEKMVNFEGITTFLIKAITTGGTGSAVATNKTIDIILKPAKPTGGTVSHSPSNKANLAISWIGLTDTDLVNYEVRKGLNWDTAEILGTTRETTYVYTVEASGNYDFLVCAKNVGGYYSNPLSLSFTATIEPLDVTGFTGVQMPNDRSKVRLSWDATTEKDFDYYEIREGTSWDSGIVIATRLTGVFYDATISEERVYRYWIRAFNKAGKFSQTPTMFESSYNMNPTTPANLTVQVDPLDKTNLMLTWSEVLDQDLQDYTLKVGATWETAEEIVKTKELKVNWRPPKSGNYKFILRARNLSGFESDDVVATFDAYIEPADVTGFVVVQNGGTVVMSWNRVSENDVVGYEIREGSSFENGSLVVTGLSETKYTINVDTETTKRYHVKAINRAGCYSQNAASANVTITGLPPKNVIFSYDEIALQNGTHENTEFGESLINFSNLEGRFSDFPNTRFDEIGGQTVLKLKHRSLIPDGNFDSAIDTNLWGTMGGSTLSKNSSGNLNLTVTSAMTTGITYKLPSILERGETYVVEYKFRSNKTNSISHGFLGTNKSYATSNCTPNSATVVYTTPNEWVTRKTDFTVGVSGTEPTYFLFGYQSKVAGDYLEIEWVRIYKKAYESLYSAGVWNMAFIPSGTYFCQRKDMGSIITANVSSRFVSSVLLRSGVSANLQYRISRDGINWTEWQNFAPVRATFRYLEFRVLLTTNDVTKTPEVNQLVESVDVPDTDKYGTATIAVGGTDVAYGYTYWQIPVVTPTAIGQGLRAELISVSRDKFRVRVLDLSGNDVGGTINWISRGF